MLHITNSIIFYGCASLPFGFEGGMWDLIVLNPDHCFFYLFGKCIELRLPKEDALTLLDG